MNEYKLDLHSALEKRFSRKDCDINALNDTCYDICHSYGDVYPGLARDCKNKCLAIISEKKREFGFNNCSKKRPVEPPHWNQIPNLFPRLLKETNNSSEALEKCYNICSNSRYTNECKEKCDLDYSALDIEEKKSDIERKDIDNRMNTTNSVNNTGMNYANTILLVFCVVLITVLCIKLVL